MPRDDPEVGHHLRQWIDEAADALSSAVDVAPSKPIAGPGVNVRAARSTDAHAVQNPVTIVWALQYVGATGLSHPRKAHAKTPFGKTNP
jgi:hypothetical protein